MSMTNVSRLTTEHSDWLRGLSFYKDELGIMKERLTEIAGKNTGDEASSNAEHFENQFKIQLTNVDTLSHDINAMMQKAAEEAEKSAGHIEEGMLKENDALRERYISEEKALHDLRYEFMRYAAKWM